MVEHVLIMVVTSDGILLRYLTDHHVDGVDVELRVVAIDEGGL